MPFEFLVQSTNFLRFIYESTNQKCNQTICSRHAYAASELSPQMTNEHIANRKKCRKRGKCFKKNATEHVWKKIQASRRAQNPRVLYGWFAFDLGYVYGQARVQKIFRSQGGKSKLLGERYPKKTTRREILWLDKPKPANLQRNVRCTCAFACTDDTCTRTRPPTKTCSKLYVRL